MVEHPRSWSKYSEPLPYAYKTQVSRMTGCTPFAHHVRFTKEPVRKDDLVFVRLELPEEDATIQRRIQNKLMAKSNGPYRVPHATIHMATILRDGLLNKVTKHRVSEMYFADQDTSAPLVDAPPIRVSEIRHGSSEESVPAPMAETLALSDRNQVDVPRDRTKLCHPMGRLSPKRRR